MHINAVQPNDQTFGAKLKVINKDFSKDLYIKLSEQAKNIGIEHDVIELKYTNFQDTLENKVFGRKSLLEPGIKRLSNIFKGRFIPCGEEYGTDHYEKRLTAEKYNEIWEMEENVAAKYLYILNKKYSAPNQV